jgi:hypothetical protein
VRLVQLDRELRRAVEEPPFARYGVARPGDEAIGVTPRSADPELLAYSGTILREAHAIDPRSTARASTLFATVFPPRASAVDMPDVAAARGYLQEFPAGPFAPYVHLALAHVHDDLFKVLRAGAQRIDDTRQCYQRFVTGEPIAAQLASTQRQGEAHYRQALPHWRDGDWLEAQRRALADGTTDRWFYCRD